MMKHTKKSSGSAFIASGPAQHRRHDDLMRLIRMRNDYLGLKPTFNGKHGWRAAGFFDHYHRHRHQHCTRSRRRTTLDALPSFRSSSSQLVERISSRVFPSLSTAGAAAPAAASALTNPLTASIVVFAALFLGYWVGRKQTTARMMNDKMLRSINNNNNVAAARTIVDFTSLQYKEDGGDDGVTPHWFNYALYKLWKLFQKNTKQVAQEAIQPVLNEVDKPEFVKAVRLVQYNVGKQSPIISNLLPVPARSLAEIQCSFNIQLQSTSDLKFEVDVVVPDTFGNKTLTIPVALSNLNINAYMWSAFTMVPYEPYCTSWRYACLTRPYVKFDMNVASTLPITAVPGLRSLFFKLIQKEIPKDFMFPRSNFVDFTPKRVRTKKREFMNMTIQEIEELSTDEIKDYFPEEYALYTSLDLDQSGVLSEDDLKQGLANWGYSTTDVKEYFTKLDTNQKGSVTFPQFCMMWPNVTSSEISQEYDGVLSVKIRDVTNLTKPALGWSQPIIELRLDNETVTTTSSDADSSSNTHVTSNENQDDDEEEEEEDDDDDDLSSVVFNESFEINGKIPNENTTLCIRVLETSKFSVRGSKVIAKAELPLLDNLLQVHDKAHYSGSPMGRRQRRVNVTLEPQGTLTLDLAFAKFVDRWDIYLTNDDDYDDKNEDSTPPSPKKKIVKLAESTVLNNHDRDDDDDNAALKNGRKQERRGKFTVENIFKLAKKMKVLK